MLKYLRFALIALMLCLPVQAQALAVGLYSNTITTSQGAAIVGAEISVMTAGTTTLVTIYSDSGGTTEKTNPTTVDANGYFSFYVPTGTYDLKIVAPGYGTSYTKNVAIISTLPIAATVSISQFNSLADAITQIGSEKKTLVCDGLTTLTQNTTIPANISLDVRNSCAITKASTYTLTDNGPVSAGLFQWLYGFSAGDVTFAPASKTTVNPVWFGYSTTFSKNTLGDNSQAPERLAYDQISAISLFDGGAATEWIYAYGTSIADDTANVILSDKAIKFNCTGSECTGADKTIALNLSTYDFIKLRFYIPDISKVISVSVYFGDATMTAHRFDAILTKATNNNLINGWNTYTIHKNDFTVGVGTPSWASIAKVRVRICCGATSYVTFNEITALKTGLSKAIVMITFDDGYTSTYTEAKRIMDKYRLAGTIFINTGNIDGGGYITKDQLHKLQEESGWDVCSHAFKHNNYTDLTSDQIAADIEQSILWLQGNGFKFIPVMSYPTGLTDNITVIPVVKKYFSLARAHQSTPTEFYGMFPIQERYSFRDTGASIYTPTQLQGFIDQAITNKAILILTFHNLVAASPGSSEYLISGFSTVIDYLITKDVDILTFSQLFKRY